jgi:hypothetical protein
MKNGYLGNILSTVKILTRQTMHRYFKPLLKENSSFATKESLQILNLWCHSSQRDFILNRIHSCQIARRGKFNTLFWVPPIFWSGVWIRKQCIYKSENIIMSNWCQILIEMRIREVELLQLVGKRNSAVNWSPHQHGGRSGTWIAEILATKVSIAEVWMSCHHV